QGKGTHQLLQKLDQKADSIQRSTDEINAGKRRLDAARRRKGGASTFKLKEYPDAYRFLKKEVRRRYRSNPKAGKAKADCEALQACRVRYSDVAREVKISEHTVRNILDGKTGSIMGGNFKR